MKTVKRLIKHDACFLLLFIFLIALCLRGPVTGLPPLLDRISQTLQLNSSQSGLLVSIPLLAFAAFAPLASWLTRFFRIEKILATGMALIALGMLVRATGSMSSLYLGALLIGAGIAIGNVLLPSLLKREFPEFVVQLTAIYVLMMGVGGFVMSSLAVPLSDFANRIQLPISGWSFALACQAVIILPAVLVWFGFKITQQHQPKNTRGETNSTLWRRLSSWQVVSFLAINSLFNYIVVAWIPAILVSHGYSDTTAGLYQGYMQLAGALPSLILAPFIQYLGSHRRLCLCATSLTVISILGWLYAPQWSGFWSLSYGFGISMGFILGLSFIGIRTDTPKQAASLSGMSQLIGYTLAALGPVLIGTWYDWQQSWQPPLYGLLLIGIIWMTLGWFASPKAEEI
ncbi:MFS transporter [Marinomonas sp. THO17]|uniref:MFS transporter n=1 Tax=Marinomonas sp. THO17 TaxID=3149048 RepID=UPI00336C0660